MYFHYTHLLNPICNPPSAFLISARLLFRKWYFLCTFSTELYRMYSAELFFFWGLRNDAYFCRLLANTLDLLERIAQFLFKREATQGYDVVALWLRWGWDCVVFSLMTASLPPTFKLSTRCVVDWQIWHASFLRFCFHPGWRSQSRWKSARHYACMLPRVC